MRMDPPLYSQTTLLAFQDAGIPVSSIQDLLTRGVYLTTAVKCAKTAYNITRETIDQCSQLLEKELAQFSNIRALLLMGDVAIKALNSISRRQGIGHIIPSTPTYKLRGQVFYFRNMRVFPSYLQAGPSFFNEKSKRKMIAQDLAVAISLLN